MALLCAVASCSARADEMRTISLADLPAQRVTDEGAWETSSWQGSDAAPWVDYPGRVTLRIEHDLGRTPTSILAYIAFEKDGAAAGLTAGDLALIMQVDDQFVTVKNGTRSDLYLRLVLH